MSFVRRSVGAKLLVFVLPLVVVAFAVTTLLSVTNAKHEAKQAAFKEAAGLAEGQAARFEARQARYSAIEETLAGTLAGYRGTGRHAFWLVGRKIEVKRLDLRPQAVEVTAQEMLTRDRIALRVTLTAFRRIVDPERVVATVPDVDAWLYRLVQFAIREAVAGRTLDEVLSAKAALDAELRDYVRERVADSGVEVTELGVKDVILPGEIRELVNKVVEAERTAKANLIRRQEETAATRSLLNTARLMEDNPLLLRLKELESLERVVEKVGRIDLHAGEGRGLDALLSNLVRLKAQEGA